MKPEQAGKSSLVFGWTIICLGRLDINVAISSVGL